MRTGAHRGSEPRASGAGSTPNRRERFAMRYRKDQKQATRQRILEAAGRRFKQDGIDGAGVATVMSDAGLTNGAFYNHFTSKEDLVANVLADQLRAQRHSFDAEPSDRAGLEAFLRSYLPAQHRDQCADGCPSAALLDEIARRPAATRQVFTDELMRVIDDIASRLDPTDADAARTDALTLFGLMLGTLQLARALTDRDLSDQLLAQGVETASKLLNARSYPRCRSPPAAAHTHCSYPCRRRCIPPAGDRCARAAQPPNPRRRHARSPSRCRRPPAVAGHAGRLPLGARRATRPSGTRPDPPKVAEIVVVMRHAGTGLHATRLAARAPREAAVAGVRSASTTRPGNSFGPGSTRASTFPSVRCCASRPARSADERGQPASHAPSCARRRTNRRPAAIRAIPIRTNRLR